jgi:ssDNA thymidine ADP-ribosyltransferase, DarT
VSAAAKRPRPTLVYRIVHIDNLATLARRGGLHSPKQCPDDGLPYRAIHDESIRLRRGARPIGCGPGGTVDDYVSFYLGPRSPMLYRIWKKQVPGCEEGQRPVVYLVSSVERLEDLGLRYVFSDGHGLMRLTTWSDDPGLLDQLDWQAIYAQQWQLPEDPDLSRRKQAELLVHGFLPWNALLGIAVVEPAVGREVKERLNEVGVDIFALKTRPDWYY